MYVMAEVISIEVEGKTLSRIYPGERIEDAGSLLRGRRDVYLVYDSCLGMAASRLAPFVRASFPVAASEEGKSMETVLEIDRWLLGQGADRKALVLALGGGIVTDMAGFAASVYKRGVDFAFIPTTLLAQVDAAIGGKTGVNLDDYKNMIGVIRQPEFTFICSELLGTLPLRDLLSGAAEMLKTFIIDNGGDRYEAAVRVISGIAAGKSVSVCREELQELVMAAAAVKAGVVSRDAFEHGERRKLNLGHTFAHAMEHCARLKGDDLTHGEAVAAGMIMAAGLSERTGTAPAGLTERLRKDFSACGLKTDCPYGMDELVGAMKLDKKADGEKIHFVLIAGIGDVVTEEMTAEEALSRLRT